MPLSHVAMAAAIVLAGATLASKIAFAHGDVTPQPIDASELKHLGKDRSAKIHIAVILRRSPSALPATTRTAPAVTELEVISGGIAPDLRYLETGKSGDEWFLERIRHGKKNSEGTTIMPAFEGVFTQEAMCGYPRLPRVQARDKEEFRMSANFSFRSAIRLACALGLAIGMVTGGVAARPLDEVVGSHICA